MSPKKCEIEQTSEITILGIQFNVEQWSDGIYMMSVFENGKIQESRSFDNLNDLLTRQGIILDRVIDER